MRVCVVWVAARQPHLHGSPTPRQSVTPTGQTVDTLSCQQPDAVRVSARQVVAHGKGEAPHPVMSRIRTYPAR